MIILSEQEAFDFALGMGNPGVCLSCGYYDEYAGCEPDARKYECPECGEFELYGFEEALMMGEIEIG